MSRVRKIFSDKKVGWSEWKKKHVKDWPKEESSKIERSREIDRDRDRDRGREVYIRI